MADFLFDGDTLIIKEPPGSGNTAFDLQRDIYSAWKRWVISGAGAGYPQAFIVEGGTPIGATGLFTGSSIILTNGWKIMGADHDHQLTINGNLFSDDGVDTVPNPSFAVTVKTAGTVGAQGISTGSGVTQQDITDIVAAMFSRAVEGGQTFEQMFRLIAADAAGDIEQQIGGSYTIKGVDGTTDRIAGQLSTNSGRTITSRDGD